VNLQAARCNNKDNFIYVDNMKRLLFCVHDSTLQTSKFSSTTIHFSLFQYTDRKYAVQGVDIGGWAVNWCRPLYSG